MFERNLLSPSSFTLKIKAAISSKYVGIQIQDYVVSQLYDQPEYSQHKSGKS
jgi:hypothetical protein